MPLRRPTDAPPATASQVVPVPAAGANVRLLPRAVTPLLALIQGATDAGIRLPVVSSWRDPARQQQLWASALQRYGSASEARKWVAPPGTSVHEKGLAVDFQIAAGISNSSANVAALRRTPAFQWLAANAEKYGWVNYQPEPWHWEYAGRPDPVDAIANKTGMIALLVAILGGAWLLLRRG